MESSNQSNNNLSDVNKTNQMTKQTDIMNSKLASLQQSQQQNQGANTNSPTAFTTGKMTAETNSQQARIDRDQSLNSSQTSSVVLERQNSAKAVHAPTNMESTLKKSNKETWTGDEIAAKLIFMLMKASNESMYEHSSRVIDLSDELAQELGIRDPQFLMELKQSAMFSDIGEFNFDLNSMPQELKAQLSEMLETEEVKDAGFLHDVGKVYIPKEILNKPTKLTDEEFEIVKQHPIVGEKMLSGIQGLAHVLPVVRHHHERWDGQGYPDKIGGEEIPYKARIISVCDAFDALVSDRPYRQGMSLKEAMAEIKAGSGSQFDPVITEVFLKMVKAKYSV
ncbi:HD-GYP domain-containing protein, partial [bacterium]|nr:HD-GYP domain-containing protein [bacterium]